MDHVRQLEYRLMVMRAEDDDFETDIKQQVAVRRKKFTEMRAEIVELLRMLDEQEQRFDHMAPNPPRPKIAPVTRDDGAAAPSFLTKQGPRQG